MNEIGCTGDETLPMDICPLIKKCFLKISPDRSVCVCVCVYVLVCECVCVEGSIGIGAA